MGVLIFSHPKAVKKGKEDDGLKKLVFGTTFLIMFLVMLSTACVAGNNPKISDYFPYLENAYYEYECTERNFFTYQAFNGYIKGNYLQRRISAEDNERAEVLENKNGELRLVYGDPGYYFYEDITGAAPNIDMLILKEPLEVGNKWQPDDRSECEITDMAATVETPFKTFEDAMEVTTVSDTGSIQKDYYVKGIGLVKSYYDVVAVLQEEDAAQQSETRQEINVSLKSFTEEPIIAPFDFYFVNSSTGEREVKSVNISLETNGNLSKELERVMKTEPEGGGVNPLISEDTKINSIKINRGENSLLIDLSKEYEPVATGDNAQCLADSIGNFYDVNMVSITAGGKATSAGRDFIVKKPEKPDTQYAPIVEE